MEILRRTHILVISLKTFSYAYVIEDHLSDRYALKCHFLYEEWQNNKQQQAITIDYVYLKEKTCISLSLTLNIR